MNSDKDFDKFWCVFPRKVKKGDARKAWTQTESIRPPLEKLLKAVIVARATEQWRRDDGKWVPYPASWLRSECWEDVHEVEVDRVRDGKAWHETVSGVERRAKQIGMEWNAREETFQQFARRVKAASDSEVVVPHQRAA